MYKHGILTCVALILSGYFGLSMLLPSNSKLLCLD